MSLSSPLFLPAGSPGIGYPPAWAGDSKKSRPGNPKQGGQAKSGGPGKPTDRNRVLMLGSVRELALYRAEVLHLHGFHVQIATSREQALDLIRLAEFDVVVVSYTLPDAIVRELSAEMREHCPECPIVAIANTRVPDRTINPDQIILADEGPAALLSALRHVLREH